MKKITDLMREKYGLSRITKTIALGPKDTIYEMFNKTAKFIYKNGLANDDWTEQDFISGIKKLDSSVKNLQRVLLPDESVKEGDFQITQFELNMINSACDFKRAKYTDKSWENHIYLATNDKGKKSVIIVDPLNSHIEYADQSWHWRYSMETKKLSKLKITGNREVHVYHGNILIGKVKLFDEMKREVSFDDISSIAKKAQITERDVALKYAEITRDLFNPEYRKYTYRFEKDTLIDEALKYGSFDPDDEACYLEYKDNIWSKPGVEELIVRNAFIDKVKHYLLNTYSFFLQAKYEDDQLGMSHARFYQQKRNIKKENLKEMQRLSNSWSDYLAGVEIDNDVDLTKLHKLVPEITATLPLLPKASDGAKPILRFRKLQNHKALGMFTTFNNTIALDFREINGQPGLQSFIHEYGHFLDYHSDSIALSLQDNFTNKIVSNVAVYLNECALQGEITVGKRGLNYLLTPTEVFARAFELYVSHLGFNNSLIKKPELYAGKTRYEYLCFSNIKEEIFNYFDDRFPALKDSIAEFLAPKPSFEVADTSPRFEKTSNLMPKTDCKYDQLSLF